MINEVSKELENLLQNFLYPEVVTSRDAISICVPKHENQDYLLGIYLYDLSQDVLQRDSFARVEGNTRYYPPKHISASYVVFCNEDTRFGGYTREAADQLLEKVIQIIHDTTSIQVNNNKMLVQFENIELEQKIRFWQSLSKPLQPAIYLKISPLLIPSLKKEKVSIVKDVHVQSAQKEK